MRHRADIRGRVLEIADDTYSRRLPRGNVLAATAFLQGLAAEEPPASAFAEDDPAYLVRILVRARKAT